mmetsp:Transcript_21341/g.63744  ORF Transcript_21341/g.63744 Transcript_21341/m.63744 type:complete len:239 (+) Transcript_21341:539-1255(+)
MHMYTMGRCAESAPITRLSPASANRRVVINSRCDSVQRNACLYRSALRCTWPSYLRKSRWQNASSPYSLAKSLKPPKARPGSRRTINSRVLAASSSRFSSSNQPTPLQRRRNTFRTEPLRLNRFCGAGACPNLKAICTESAAWRNPRGGLPSPSAPDWPPPPPLLPLLVLRDSLEQPSSTSTPVAVACRDKRRRLDPAATGEKARPFRDAEQAAQVGNFERPMGAPSNRRAAARRFGN